VDGAIKPQIAPKAYRPLKARRIARGIAMNIQTNSPIAAPLKVAKTRSGKDPILLELWEIKRQINQQANFDIAQLTKQANAFDLQTVMKQLKLAIAH
jgi:hypothetical protein